jgi:hypothetical protein
MKKKMKQMKKTLKLIRKFEKRNNKAIVINFIGDGSGEIRGFWKDEILEEFESIRELHELLIGTLVREK